MDSIFVSKGAYLNGFTSRISVIHYSAYPIKSKTRRWAHESSWRKLGPVSATGFHSPYRTLILGQNQTPFIKTTIVECCYSSNAWTNQNNRCYSIITVFTACNNTINQSYAPETVNSLCMIKHPVPVSLHSQCSAPNRQTAPGHRSRCPAPGWGQTLGPLRCLRGQRGQEERPKSRSLSPPSRRERRLEQNTSEEDTSHTRGIQKGGQMGGGDWTHLSIIMLELFWSWWSRNVRPLWVATFFM